MNRLSTDDLNDIHVLSLTWSLIPGKNEDIVFCNSY